MSPVTPKKIRRNSGKGNGEGDASISRSLMKEAGTHENNPIWINADDDDDDNDDDAVISWFPAKKRKAYFKGECSSSSSSCSYSSTNPKKKKKKETFMCEICADEKPKTECFRICGCTHFYCSECMSKYVASKLQENITKISCPFQGCTAGTLNPENCRSILPPEVFERWGDVLCEALILGTEKFYYCPFKDCSALLIDEMHVRKTVTTSAECPNCSRLFCAKCRVPWHSDISCDDFKKLNEDEREREDILLFNLAKKEKWMRCPKCKFFVEKSEGCLAMKCRCKYFFCYTCGGKITGIFHSCARCKY